MRVCHAACKSKPRASRDAPVSSDVPPSPAMSTRISSKCHEKVKMSDFEGCGISETKTDRSSLLESNPSWSQKCSIPFERDFPVFHAPAHSIRCWGVHCSGGAREPIARAVVSICRSVGDSVATRRSVQ